MSRPARSWLAYCGLVLLAGGAAETARAKTQSDATQAKDSRETEERFKDFLDKVNGYDKLRNSLRGTIPAVGKKATAEEIQRHQEMLEAKIEEARKDAKQGDIFTADSQKAFRHAI